MVREGDYIRRRDVTASTNIVFLLVQRFLPCSHSKETRCDSLDISDSHWDHWRRVVTSLTRLGSSNGQKADAKAQTVETLF